MAEDGHQADAGARTLAVHAGSAPDPATGSEGVPVHRTTGFAFPTVREMTETFAGRTGRFIYTRFDNPTLRESEEKLAALEDGGPHFHAVLFSSGMAAITAALMAALQAGDHLIAQEEIYGGTTGLLGRVLPRCGMTCDFLTAAELSEPRRLRAAARPATRAILLESPCNPTLRVVEIEAVCRTARELGAAVMIDNTLASPIHQKPLKLGCEVVIHSATKYLAGHDDLTAGFVVASGELLARIRQLRIDLGGCLDPSAAWLLARSMKTLALRVHAQSHNAMAVAQRLQQHPKVARVHYPGLPSHPGHEIAARQMTGFGGILSFELAAEGNAPRFVEALRLIRMVPTFGGLATTVTVPAASSHFCLSPERRRAMGIGEDLIRLSVGIEEVSDIIADLERALG
ncbi:MAG TPA: PLP-dependent aspartate aminotransferase family protein [Candidatus Polarisedimenticolia bacterium]